MAAITTIIAFVAAIFVFPEFPPAAFFTASATTVIVTAAIAAVARITTRLCNRASRAA